MPDSGLGALVCYVWYTREPRKVRTWKFSCGRRAKWRLGKCYNLCRAPQLVSGGKSRLSPTGSLPWSPGLGGPNSLIITLPHRGAWVLWDSPPSPRQCRRLPLRLDGWCVFLWEAGESSLPRLGLGTPGLWSPVLGICGHTDPPPVTEWLMESLTPSFYLSANWRWSCSPVGRCIWKVGCPEHHSRGFKTQISGLQCGPPRLPGRGDGSEFLPLSLNTRDQGP